MFDLKTLAIKDSTTVHLRHPVTEELLFGTDGNPVEAVVWSSSSKQYRNAITAMQNRALKRGKKQPSAEQMRDEGVALLVACTQRFNNLALEGQPLDNEDAIRALYLNDEYSWVKSQVDEALGDVSNFIKA